ncbi:MAG: thiosulfate oxidation carrier protein SoxY [Alphaproteobacteria bacterium]|jgi:sulfur-oxidizing protein SoxY|nr:thiosulfate oxidation carrier protein SoxY [Alphaproteobacteria bacterium]
MQTKIVMQPVTRRTLMAFAGAGAVATLTGALLPGLARADAKAVADSIKKLIGDKTPKSGRIALELPQIAENGNTVPIALEVESPMTETDYVKAVHVFADQNPNPDVATFRFTSASGKAKVSTRMRMIKTQNVIALAEMSDGSIYMAKAEVKVTIGGCGG